MLKSELVGLNIVRDRESQRQHAAREGDVVRLESLLHSNLIYVHATARQDTKASYIESISTGRVSYENFNCYESDYRLVSATVATVTGGMRTDLIAHGVPKSIDVLFLAVWLRDDFGLWQLSAWQSTFVPTPVL